MGIYLRVKELRQKKGLTQYQLAEAIGLQLPGLQKIEYNQNKSIPFETLEKLCLALDCTPGDLIVLDDAPDTSNNIAEAVAILESLLPTSEQKWDRDYKDALYHGLREAIAKLARIKT